jgi:hypothetical protein
MNPLVWLLAVGWLIEGGKLLLLVKARSRTVTSRHPRGRCPRKAITSLPKFLHQHHHSEGLVSDWPVLYRNTQNVAA